MRLIFKFVLSALLLVVASIEVFRGGEPTVTAEEVRVPDLRGHHPDLAEQRLRLRHLRGVSGRFYVAPENWRHDVAEGHVYLQTPKPSIRSAPGATVAYWTLSQAAADRAVVQVPSVKGKTQGQAVEALENAGLSVMTVEVPALAAGDVSTPGTVMEQYPRAGRSVFQGNGVLLHVYRPN